MKVIALDIETKNLDMKAEGLDFNNPDGWKVSCVSIWHPTSGAYNYAGKDYFGSMAMSFEQLKDEISKDNPPSSAKPTTELEPLSICAALIVASPFWSNSIVIF